MQEKLLILTRHVAVDHSEKQTSDIQEVKTALPDNTTTLE